MGELFEVGLIIFENIATQRVLFRVDLFYLKVWSDDYIIEEHEVELEEYTSEVC